MGAVRGHPSDLGVLAELEREAARYGVRLDAQQLAQFERYLSLLSDWSERANLVADATPDVVVRRHILESIALGAALREREMLRPDARVLDVGAGAGFPGAVIAIVWPAVRVTLLEATSKKTDFLRALVDELALGNASIVSGRAETLAHDPALRARFDLVLARAVAPLRVLIELTLPFVRVGGRLVTPKGSRAEQEVEEAAVALRVLGGRAVVAPFGVPGPPQKLVVVIKQTETPPSYPRRPGQPGKTPL